MVGKHHLCGYKFEKWYSIIWMDKSISEKIATPVAFIPFAKYSKHKSAHKFQSCGEIESNRRFEFDGEKANE